VISQVGFSALFPSLFFTVLVGQHEGGLCLQTTCFSYPIGFLLGFAQCGILAMARYIALYWISQYWRHIASYYRIHIAIIPPETNCYSTLL